MDETAGVDKDGRTAAAKPVRARRSQASANRERIIEAAIGAFAANPDASMDDVARAAGVVRRTVYGHFPNRDALVEGIVDEASTTLAAALGGVPAMPGRPDLGTAMLALFTWPIGDRFRMLLTFARRELGEERIRELIQLVRGPAREIIERGQADGTFSTYLPASVLVGLTESITFGLIEEANAGAVDDPGKALGVVALVILGLSPERAAEVVDEARRWLGAHAATPGP
ncbi:TetR/AcrR family transcriptional regulator [Rhodococcus kronopolitis]|uniref:TetR/AcrR family transcriptional regulator n=1 Tax=Rhodococcus kronopolitis TaxID=1460226 RepID=A0ABV9FPL3_9NOCA